MIDTQRHELYLAIMSGSPALEHPEDYHELSQMAVEEVERIEPLIDRWMLLAENDGRLKALLEQAYVQQVPIMQLKRKIESLT